MEPPAAARGRAPGREHPGVRQGLRPAGLARVGGAGDGGGAPRPDPGSVRDAGGRGPGFVAHLLRAIPVAGSGDDGRRGRPAPAGRALPAPGGDHMVDYLPAIYREQDFTYRYLSIFNSMFQDMEAAIDDLPRLLDAASAPPEMLSFLAKWLCVDPEEGGDLRRRLPQVLEEYKSMYTPEGIARSTQRLTGRRPWIVEHFAVDPNDPDCRNPGLYRRLYGEDPYRFFLLLPQDTFSDQRELERFLSRMRELIPAETTLELVLLKPCVQLDWHTYLGINSQIGSYVQAAIDEKMTIHYNTTIGGADHE